VQDVREDDDLEGIAARGPARGIEPVVEAGQQGRQLTAQLRHLLRSGEHG
jgi:hypothetical protein